MTALPIRAIRGMDRLRPGRQGDSRSDVRVLFDADLLSFRMPGDATYADLAERIGRIESRGAPRHIALLLRPRAASTARSKARLN